RALGRFRSIRGRETWAGLAMIAPAGVLLVLFLVIPVLLAFGLSFTNARLISPNPPRFVGLDNFARAFGADPMFLQSAWNTFLF
ncbi:sugar ABC transporter permease, partial [Streptomyces galilaeus]